MTAVNMLGIVLGLLFLLGLGWIFARRQPQRRYGRRQPLPEPGHCFRAPKAIWVREEIIGLKRPHPSLQGRTPAEIWAGSDVHQRRARPPIWFEAWDGLLAGEYVPP